MLINGCETRTGVDAKVLSSDNVQQHGGSMLGLGFFLSLFSSFFLLFFVHSFAHSV